MLSPFDPHAADRAERERYKARWDPERETLELAAAGAAKVLGLEPPGAGQGAI